MLLLATICTQERIRGGASCLGAPAPDLSLATDHHLRYIQILTELVLLHAFCIFLFRKAETAFLFISARPGYTCTSNSLQSLRPSLEGVNQFSSPQVQFLAIIQ